MKNIVLARTRIGNTFTLKLSAHTIQMKCENFVSFFIQFFHLKRDNNELQQHKKNQDETKQNDEKKLVTDLIGMLDLRHFFARTFVLSSENVCSRARLSVCLSVFAFANMLCNFVRAYFYGASSSSPNHAFLLIYKTVSIQPIVLILCVHFLT